MHTHHRICCIHENTCRLFIVRNDTMNASILNTIPWCLLNNIYSTSDTHPSPPPSHFHSITHLERRSGIIQCISAPARWRTTSLFPPRYMKKRVRSPTSFSLSCNSRRQIRRTMKLHGPNYSRKFSGMHWSSVTALYTSIKLNSSQVVKQPPWKKKTCDITDISSFIFPNQLYDKGRNR